MSAAVGIEAINAYCGMASVSVEAIFAGRGLDQSRFGNLLMNRRSVQLPWEDPVTNAANAARPLLDALGDEGRRRIGLLIVSTESGLDYSKSVASYVHAQLGLSTECRMFEVKQACYGATGALQLAAGYLASGLTPQDKALVIATDVNPMDERAGYAEPTTGHGSVAMLVGTEPRVFALGAAHGSHSYEVMDTARPSPDLDLYNTDLSLLSYLDCLAGSFRAYASRVPGASFPDGFPYLAMHMPFGGMVKAAHRKMMREAGVRAPQAVEDDFQRRIGPSLRFGQEAGNLCSGSLYLALASLIACEPASEGAAVGMFSYGSGCASEFFGGTVGTDAGAVVASMDIPGRLRARRELTFEEYEALVPVARSCLVPTRHRSVDLSAADELIADTRPGSPTLVLDRIENHHRRYAWR